MLKDEQSVIITLDAVHDMLALVLVYTVSLPLVVPAEEGRRWRPWVFRLLSRFGWAQRAQPTGNHFDDFSQKSILIHIARFWDSIGCGLWVKGWRLLAYNEFSHACLHFYESDEPTKICFETTLVCTCSFAFYDIDELMKTCFQTTLFSQHGSDKRASREMLRNFQQMFCRTTPHKNTPLHL